ncbi:hypothetical protein Gohar_025451, partial [Gossypium harknessii]|nr:hypothetical protein [Gossypium harknessii]
MLVQCLTMRMRVSSWVSLVLLA